VEKIGDWAFSGCAELPSIAEWKEDVEIVGFDETNERLIIKGTGKLEDYADRRKICKMKVYVLNSNGIAPWRKKHEDLIRSVVFCYGVSSIGDAAFENARI